ncbi:hypothetical protein ACFX13_013547 [Malus domestica]
MQEDNGKTPAQKFTSEEGVPNVRGWVLDGSSMINAGFYTTADKEFFMKSGIEWDMYSVYKAYRWVEETIVFPPTMDRWQSAVAKAFMEADVGPDNGLNLDHIKGTKIGGSTFDNNGKRHGAVELLNKGDLNKLRVAVQATVEKILFSSKASSSSAIGIMYSDSNGRSHCAYVRRKWEAVLSAGAIGSPQLLQLSGIGPESYLSSLKIPVVSPHPYIGQFMYDNPCNLINILPPIPLEPSPVKIVGPMSYGPLRLQSSSDAYLLPKNQTDDVSFPTFCQSSVATFWHFQGGSIVGKVVDSGLRVLGINALRVMDASTFNFPPGANPQDTLMDPLLAGMYVGLKMLQERSA